MTIAEIFQKINAHQIKGMMTHAQLADYFDFLNLRGYKRIHEYHYLDETVCNRSFNRYFINHFNMMIPIVNIENPEIIPTSWFMYSRKDVDSSTRKKAIATAFEKWVDWENESKELYEKMYKESVAIDEIAAAMKIKELVCDVDQELKCAERMFLSLRAVDYDQSYVYETQDCLHEEYREKEKHLGADIC